eukprot:1918161-Amphidinium_carterae.1
MARWASDEYKYPAYHYAADVIIFDGAGRQLRTPTINEKELFLGLPLDHTFGVAHKHGRQAPHLHDLERHKTIGRASHVGVLMWLLSPVLQANGDVATHFGWGIDKQSATEEDERALVNFWLSRTSRKGQDLR